IRATKFPRAVFILPLPSHYPLEPHAAMLIANCLAQTQALMLGKSEHEVREELQSQGLDSAAVQKLAPHKVFPGNRPSNTIVMDQLTPFTLGALIALYEHKV